MIKILILVVMVFGLVAGGEKFPYTSQRDKEKMSKELLVAIEKAQETRNEKDTQVAMEKMGEIIKIISELEKRSSSGDEKAKEELDKWEKILKEIKPQV